MCPIVQVFRKHLLLHRHKGHLGRVCQQLPRGRPCRHHRGRRSRHRLCHRCHWNSQCPAFSDGRRCWSPRSGNNKGNVHDALVCCKVRAMLPAYWHRTEARPSMPKIVLKVPVYLKYTSTSTNTQLHKTKHTYKMEMQLSLF